MFNPGGASEKAEWETINADLTSVLEGLSSDRKLDKMETSSGATEQNVGIRDRKEKAPMLESRFRRQQEFEFLFRERRQLKKQWRKACESKKQGINLLQGNIRCVAGGKSD